MSAIDFVKRHPVAIGAGAVALIIIFMIASAGGSEEVQGNTSDVAAGVALQQAQMGYQAQMSALNAAAQDKASDRELALKVAEMDYLSKKELANINANLMSQQISSQQQTTALVSTLAAQTSQREIDAAVQREQINAGIINKQTDALVSINAMMQQTQQQAIKKQCSGFFDCLF